MMVNHMKVLKRYGRTTLPKKTSSSMKMSIDR
jgi:hypothetical protein